MCGAVCGKSARTVLRGVRGSDSSIYLTLGMFGMRKLGEDVTSDADLIE